MGKSYNGKLTMEDDVDGVVVVVEGVMDGSDKKSDVDGKSDVVVLGGEGGWERETLISFMPSLLLGVKDGDEEGAGEEEIDEVWEGLHIE